MRRLLAAILPIPIGLAAALLGVWYFVYGLPDTPYNTALVEGLAETAEIRWHDSGTTGVTAATPEDAYAALGYVHGFSRSWQALLLRQAALGSLSEWFGESTLAFDAEVRALGIASGALNAYRNLPADARALLEAFSSGLNSALETDRVLRNELVVVVNAPVAPWEPWHSLAIERLLAWFARSTDAEVPFELDDQAGVNPRGISLRMWLGIGNLADGRAWILPSAEGPMLGCNLAPGSTAIPYLSLNHVRVGAATEMTGLSWSGVPFSFAGFTAARSWCVVPRSHVDQQMAPADSSSEESFVRLQPRDGAERIVRFGGSPLGRYQPTETGFDDFDRSAGGAAGAPDSTWLLQWAGLSPVSDAVAWLGLETGVVADFSLLHPVGLILRADGSVQTIGDVATERNGVYATAGQPWGAPVRARLARLGARRQLPSRILADAESEWARSVVPILIGSVDARVDTPPLVEASLEYLRNWDFTFVPASIAASIVDRWAHVLEQYYDVRPNEIVRVDSTGYVVTAAAFETAVELLATRYGNDPSVWRWERVQNRRLVFPGWLGVADRTPILAQTRYAPMEIPGNGHPSTVAWGVSAADARSSATAVTVWTTTEGWDFRVTGIQSIPRKPFGRYLSISGEQVSATAMRGEAPVSTTRLLPAPRELD